MTTRDVLRWFFSPRDLIALASLNLAAALLVVLDAACVRLEDIVDGRS